LVRGGLLGRLLRPLGALAVLVVCAVPVIGVYGHREQDRERRGYGKSSHGFTSVRMRRCTNKQYWPRFDAGFAANLKRKRPRGDVPETLSKSVQSGVLGKGRGLTRPYLPRASSFSFSTSGVKGLTM
jgi:hypothetical protein